MGSEKLACNRKVECPNCKKQIGYPNLAKHLEACLRGKGLAHSLPYRSNIQKERDGFICGFCGRYYSTVRSASNHATRCAKNPNRQGAFNLLGFVEKNLKGKTKETSVYVKKQAETMKQLYSSGYVSPSKGVAKGPVLSIYADHNSEEIRRWQNYTDSITVDVTRYKICSSLNDGYQYFSIADGTAGESFTGRYPFVHVLVASILLGRDLKEGEVVHHIDRDKLNNNKENILVFSSATAHSKYHSSSKAYLIYDEETHLFDCIDKNIPM